MTTVRLTHPTRDTLEFRQVQQDRDPVTAVANITAEIGDDRAPLVHVQTRERERSLSGRVTAPRRARQTGEDWEQALADYAIELESHIDEFQGDGYTLVDDIRGESLSAIFHRVEWTYRGGEPYDLLFDGTVTVGRGVFAEDTRTVDSATVNTGMDIIATIGGEDLPGFREMTVSKEYAVNAAAVVGETVTAEDNDVVPESGVEHRFTIGGTHTGSESERADADAALRDLQDRTRYDLVTRFPGYTKQVKVLNYESNFDASFGCRQHRYELTCVVAREDGQT